MTQQVTVYYDARGYPQTSLLESMLVWRKHYGKEFLKTPVPLDEHGFCKWHGSSLQEEIEDAQYGVIRCFCAIKREQEYFTNRLANFRSAHAPRHLTEIKVWGSSEGMDSIMKLIDAVRAFNHWPDKWLTIAGAPGTGKTHALHYLAESFGPWALYITDSEFETMVYELVGQEGQLNIMLDAIRHAPILLYDDLGSGYHATFTTAVLRRVIDFRYNRWKEFPTVITTNLKPDALRMLDMRIADRARDREKAIYVSLNGVGSWRTKDGS